jgi:hypothetical protein
MFVFLLMMLFQKIARIWSPRRARGVCKLFARLSEPSPLLEGSSRRSLSDGVPSKRIAFAIFPVIVVYLLLSKYIVCGVTAGGVKE